MVLKYIYIFGICYHEVLKRSIQHTINGNPGPLFEFPIKDVFMVLVEYEKNESLHIINVEPFFNEPKYHLKMVVVDAVYTNQLGLNQ